MRKSLIIPASKAARLKHAIFHPFERRPVNYYRDMIVEETHPEPESLRTEEIERRIEQAVSAERARLERLSEAEARRQFEAGMARGREEAGREVRQAVELLGHYGSMLQAEKQELTARCERSSIDLAFLLARRIVDRELEVHPEAVTDVVRSALQQVLDCERVRLRVHPQDLAFIRSVQADLETQLSGQVPLDLAPDGTVERGGCLIETERGTLDARISSQLETLRASVAQGER